jgi:hypothetical protein
MALVRWNPLREMATLQQQMNRLFDETLVRVSEKKCGGSKLAGILR